MSTPDLAFLPEDIFVRRLITGSLAFLAVTGTVLVLPVYAAPAPDPEPVATSTDAVAMGSVEDPAPAADVQEGTTDPVAGVPDTAPTLTVRKTDVAPFSLVGVTWAHDPAVTDTVVQVRVQGDGGAWGTWTEVGMEDADQNEDADSGAGPRGGTAPLWTGPSTGVEAELVTRSGAQPTDVQLDLVDPGSSPADSMPGTPEIQDTADAALNMPDVYSRAQWGADESIRTWGPEYAPTIKAATLHHTADTNNYTAADVPAMMRSIYRYHTVSRGWGDLGYNVIVDKFGRLWEGRYGGLASTVIGAHAGGFNTGTFGVSMLGNYDTAATPQPMIDAVAAIIAWKFSLYNVNPYGTTTLTSGGGGTSKYAAGVKVTLPTIFGHRDVGNTTCPGQYGYARLGEIRNKVAAWLGSPESQVQARYDSDAAARSRLGAQTVAATRLPDGIGAYAGYANGWIYWSPATGAQIVTAGAVRDKWGSLGWERGSLGYPVGDSTCGLVDGGCFQHFQNGSVYWSPASGAHTITDEIRDKWGSLGWERSGLGYPTTDQTPIANGAEFSHFQGGSIYWSAGTGAHVVGGEVRNRWEAAGWETGVLGLPVSDLTCGLSLGGCFAHFQNGSIYWTSTTGARLLLSPIRDKWGTTGWETGALGWPVADQVATPGGSGQVVAFERGWVYWSAATGARVVGGQVRDTWLAGGGDGGALGLPVSDVGSTPDGKASFAHFQGGSVYVHVTLGARVLPTAIRDGWAVSGWETGPLGYPTGDATAIAGGTAQTFQGGRVFASGATGGHAVLATALSAYLAAGGPGGALGFPTSDRGALTGSNWFQHFQGGSVYSSAAGVFVVPAAVRSVWERQGWETGPLGYPVAAAVSAPGSDGSGSVTSQAFQGGVVYASSAGAFAVSQAFAAAVSAAASTTGVLGAPTSEVRSAADGKASYQLFAGGEVWSSAGGVHVLAGEVLAGWKAAGGGSGVLGYPVTDVLPLAAGGRFAHFQGGSVYWSPASGAHVVRGAVRDAWAAVGWENSALGYPVSDVVTLPDGRGQAAVFQHGSIYWSPASGAHIVGPELRDAWARWGWENGVLGYPVTDVAPLVNGGRFVHFQGGSIYWSPATGAHVVRGAVRDAWAATGWETGPLGYPTTDVVSLPDGRGQAAVFQGGSIYWTQATGAHAIRGVIRDAWAASGSEPGPLGYPTSDVRTVSGGTRQDFQGGYITVSGATGQATVHKN